MKNWVCLAILSLLANTGQAKKAVTDHNRSRKISSGAAKQSARSRKVSYRRYAATRVAAPVRQLTPSNDRYREIQEALAQKGYLHTPPNGLWDVDSQDAMRRFQADRNLDSSGKLTSRSIIALGLGSPNALPAPAVPPAATVPLPPKPENK